MWQTQASQEPQGCSLGLPRSVPGRAVPIIHPSRWGQDACPATGSPGSCKPLRIYSAALGWSPPHWQVTLGPTEYSCAILRQDGAGFCKGRGRRYLVFNTAVAVRWKKHLFSWGFSLTVLGKNLKNCLNKYLHDTVTQNGFKGAFMICQVNNLHF